MEIKAWKSFRNPEPEPKLKQKAGKLSRNIASGTWSRSLRDLLLRTRGTSDKMRVLL